jgi:hypothetical protein
MGPARRRVVRVAVAVAAVVGVAVLAASAGAGPFGRADRHSGPVARVAFSSNGGVESTNDTVPGNGSGEIATDTLPSAATQASIEIKPQQSGQADYDRLNAFLTSLPSARARILTCFALSLAALKGLSRKGVFVAFTDEDSALPFLFLQMCVVMALNIEQQHIAGDLAGIGSAATCARTVLSVPVKITRVGGKYRGNVSGKTSTPPGRAPFSVSCKRKGTAIVIAIKPTKRGRTLRQTVGSNLGIAFLNPTSKPVGVHATFTVK